MAFRELVVEAIKKTTIIANKVANNLNLAEYKNINRMSEMNSDYIADLAALHDIRFDDLSDDDKQEVIEKIWNKIKSGEKPAEVMDETPDENKPLSQSELKQKIIDYVKANGAVFYPLEDAAEKLAQELANVQEAEEKCPCCGESPCKCGPDCECGCDKKESITEAVMNDIPHEIDDQIHTLKDMRFDLEQTKKNWNIAGVDTQPMDKVLSDIDGLIASLYQNGAKMADDEISKGSSEEKEVEQEE